LCVNYVNVVSNFHVALQDLVNWYTAIRHVKLTRLRLAYPLSPVNEVKGIFKSRPIGKLITPPRMAGLRDRSFCHSVIRSFVRSAVSRITHEHVNGRRGINPLKLINF